MPKISIVMAAYNGQKFIAETIESVLLQTFRDFEFIIINDASTDRTEEIVKNFQEQDSRVQLINNRENLERAVSRNIGIERSIGEYLCIIDADDIFLPDKLEKQVKFLDARLDVGFVATSHYVIDENGIETDIVTCSGSERPEIVHFMCNPSIMVRRECLAKVGGYRSIMVPAEDYDLWLRIAFLYKPANIVEPLFKYRVHGASSTARQKEQMAVAVALALEMAEERSREGHDSLDGKDEDVALLKRRKYLDTQGRARRMLLSKNNLVWSRASIVIGDYEKSLRYVKNSISMYPANLLSWRLLLQIFKKIIIAKFKKFRLQSFSDSYVSSCKSRQKYWELRACDIDEKWGDETSDFCVLGEIINRISPKKILDIGCGSGRLFPLYDIMKIDEVVGQDISEKALEISKIKRSFRNISITSKQIYELNYSDKYFDLIISNKVLEHITSSEIDKTLESIVRLSDYIYINEAIKGDGTKESFYLTQHNYHVLFNKYGYSEIDRGIIGPQRWFLFFKN